MFNFLRKHIPDTHPIRLIYHYILAIIAAIVYGLPANKLKVIGITGTNGKTTVTNLIAFLLENSGKKVGMATTINFQVGKKKWNNVTKKTTQGPFFLQKLLKDMVKNGVEYAVLEISSHSLLQNRVFGISFDTAVITNISKEHIEYHNGLQNYIDAKGKLFAKLKNSRKKPDTLKVSIINIDDPYYKEFEKFSAQKHITYGLHKGIFHSSNIQYSIMGSSFILHNEDEKIEIKSNLPGDYNIYNVLAACAAVIPFGLTLNDVKNGVEDFKGVPGRSELIEEGQKFTIVVDYGHTPEALENICKIFKKLVKEGKKLILIFGATGGGRDKCKRPFMGQVADKYADIIILTDDDPYTEDRMSIIEQIAGGIKRQEGKTLYKIVSRKDAISLGLNLANDEDIVIVAGKGCEEIQIIGEEHIPWDDREVIRSIINNSDKNVK